MLNGPIDLIGMLADTSSGGLDALHSTFEDNDGLIDVDAFVEVMDRHSSHMRELVAKQGVVAARSVFNHIDSDGDGKISWDDVYAYAEGSARQRMDTRPAERIRPYSFSRFHPRDDNVVRLEYIDSVDKILTTSRHRPLDMLDAHTLQVRHSFTTKDMGGSDSVPKAVAYMPGCDSLAVFCSDMRLRLWGFLDHTVVALKPVVCEYAISKLAAPVTGTSLFASDRSGLISVYDINRQALNEPMLRESIKVTETWPCKSGGVSDFTFVDSADLKLIAASYDHTIVSLDVTSRRVQHIGRTKTAVTKLRHCTGYHCVAAVSVDQELTTWVTHQSQSPCTVLSDASRPHLHKIVGLDHVPHTPQVITTDSSGLVKIWDLRVFRCVQSMMVGATSDTIDDVSDSTGASRRAAAYNGACYVRSTTELLVSDPGGFTLHEYDKGADPRLADNNETIAVAYNATANGFVTCTANSLSMWDAEKGVLLMTNHVDGGEALPVPQGPAVVVRSSHRGMQRTEKKEIKAKIDTGKAEQKDSESKLAMRKALVSHHNVDITCMCLDSKGRLFLGTQAGTVQLRSYHGNTLIKVLPMHTKAVVAIAFSETHRAIVSCGADGVVSVYNEGEQLSPLARMKVASVPLTALDVSPDLAVIAVGSQSGRSYLLDLAHARTVLEDIEPPRLRDGADPSVSAITFLHSFPIVAIGHSCGRVILCSVRPASEMNRLLMFTALPSPEAPILDLRKSSNVNAFLPQRSDTSLFDDATLLTAMEFNRQEHTLITGDSMGSLHVWSLCPMLQGLGLQHATYPQPVFSLPTPPRSHRMIMKPVLQSSFKAHQDEIVAIHLIEAFGLIATAGGDRHVNVWKDDGTRCGELSMGRLPDDARSTIRKSILGSELAERSPGNLRTKTIRRVMAKIETYHLFKGLGAGGPKASLGKCEHDLEQRGCEDAEAVLELLAPPTDAGSMSLTAERLARSQSMLGGKRVSMRLVGEGTLSAFNVGSVQGDDDGDDLSSSSEILPSFSDDDNDETLRKLLRGRRPTARLRGASISKATKTSRKSTSNPTPSTATTAAEESPRGASTTGGGGPAEKAKDGHKRHLETLLGEPPGGRFEDSENSTRMETPKGAEVDANQDVADREEHAADPVASSSLPALVGPSSSTHLQPVEVSAPAVLADEEPSKPPSGSLSSKDVLSRSDARIRTLTNAEELRVLHERKNRAHERERARSAREKSATATVGIAQLVPRHPANPHSARMNNGLARARTSRGFGASIGIVDSAAEDPHRQSVGSPRVRSAALPQRNSVAARTVHSARSGRVHHQRAPTAPKGRLIPTRPTAKPDERTQRLSEYQDELKRCLEWRGKDLHQRLLDDDTMARQWSASGIRGDFFLSVLESTRGEQ